jgi:nitroreductase
MQKLSGSQLLESLEWRYATKAFDRSKKIDEKTWNALEQTLVLTPSSFGAMPYKFIIIQDQALKDQLVPFSYGQNQVADCSHHVVFVAKEKMDSAHLKKYIDQMAHVRGVPASSLEGYEKMMNAQLVERMSPEQSSKWAANQTYIALGNFMTAAALLGVDTCPMEGIVPAKYDEILGLTGSGWKTICACPAGYRASGDKYAEAKKVRFETKDLIVHK